MGTFRKLIDRIISRGWAAYTSAIQAQSNPQNLSAGQFNNLSKQQVVLFVNENLPAKQFVGLGLDQKATDHSTLTVFRKRLTRQGTLKVFGEILADIVQIMQDSEIQFASIQVIDNAHTTPM